MAAIIGSCLFDQGSDVLQQGICSYRYIINRSLHHHNVIPFQSFVPCWEFIASRNIFQTLCWYTPIPVYLRIGFLSFTVIILLGNPIILLPSLQTFLFWHTSESGCIMWLMEPTNHILFCNPFGIILVAAYHDIKHWPAPTSGVVLSLPLLGTALEAVLTRDDGSHPLLTSLQVF